MNRIIKTILSFIISLLITLPLWAAGLDDSIIKEKDEQVVMRYENSDTSKSSKAIARKITELEQENKTIRSGLEKQNIITALAIVFVFFLLLMVFILYLSNQKARQLNEQLAKERNESEEKSEEIKQQKEEIEAINNSLELMVMQRTQELKLTVDSLSQRNKDLEQFSYIVSHNLRAPIARLIGLTDIFDYEHLANPINQTVLTHSKTSAQQLDEVVKDLTYILAIRNDTNLSKEVIDLEESANLVIENLNVQIEEAKPKITFDFSGGREVISERSYIENILYQLISNAVKHRKKRETLQLYISTVQQDNMLKLSVQDNGMGINLTNMNPYKIFGLYQRMHTHTEGKGLGLYLVKTQIEALGGSVEVESKENIGSTFSIFLPLC